MVKELAKNKRIKSIVHDCPYLPLNGSAGETICFTDDNFVRGRIWADVPKCIYIDWLEPIEPWEVSLKKMFDEIDINKFKFVCSCPQERIRRFLSKRYILCFDVAGSRFYSNFIPKNISSIVIPEDQGKLLIGEKLSPSDKRLASLKVQFRPGTPK